MTKIDIISGFLGAGKTTFIKKLLKEAIAGEKVVLIENEFGEIGIDGGFLKDSGIEIRNVLIDRVCGSLIPVGAGRFLVRRQYMDSPVETVKIPRLTVSDILIQHHRLVLGQNSNGIDS